MYALSIAYLTVEYTFVDVFHLEIQNFDGVTLNGGLVQTWMQMSALNSITDDIINGSYTPTNGTFYDRVETSVTAGAAVGWNLILLLTGLYIFNLILFLGVPSPLVVGLAILYVFLLARTIVAIIRGI
jgi:hypothetical protein